MRGVSALVCYALFLSAFIVFSNSQTTPTTPTSKAPPTTKPGAGKANQTSHDTLQCDVYNLTLKLPNATFEENLLNPHSAEFNKLRSDFEVGIMQVYDGYKPFTGVTTLRFSKAPDGKTIVHFCIEFKDNGTHLPNLTAALKGGKLGKLTPLSVAPKLGQAACFQAPPPPVCQAPCPSTCAPNCYDNCCQGGYQTFYVPAPPPPPMPVPMPTPSACPNACPNTCLPVGCSPACCNTLYNQAQNPYGKRHHAPKPLKAMKKRRIFGKQHRKQ